MKQPDVVKTAQLAQKIFKAKKEMGAVIKKEDNPFFKSKYADINEIIRVVSPALESNGLLLLQPVVANANGLNYVTSRLYDIETGESTESAAAIDPEIKDPQKFGAAITYFRRFTLQSLLGLSAEDDDGNTASGKTKKAAPTKRNSSADF